jgi:hypothetical protein
MIIKEIIHHKFMGKEAITRIYPVGFDTAAESKKYNAIYCWTAKNPCIFFFRKIKK